MEKAQLIEKVEAAIDQVRPYLVADGGNIELVDITADNIVQVNLQGACSSCPMGLMTLKQGVEMHVKKCVPEIVSVEALNLKY